jgi:hypothetical protein
LVESKAVGRERVGSVDNSRRRTSRVSPMQMGQRVPKAWLALNG